MSESRSSLADRIHRLFLLEPGEGRTLAVAGLFHFIVLGVNGILTPLRDALGLEQGVDKLPWLIWSVLVATMVMNPPFGMLLRKLGGRRLAKFAFRFGTLCLLGFSLALSSFDPREHPWLARGIYVWVTVFNLFFVSLFWSIATDTFDERQGKRLFATVGAAGTLGQIAGAWGATQLANLHRIALIPLVAGVLLEVATACIAGLKSRQSQQTRGVPAPARPERGGTFDAAITGLKCVSRSPYLLAICAFMLLYTFTTQFQKLETSNIVNGAIATADGRTAFFGSVRQWVQTATLVVQLLVAGRLIRWIGVTGGMVLVPLVTIAGFAVLGAEPVLTVVVAFEIARSALNYSITRLSREVLWTSVTRDERFAAKSFIETFVYRGGDALAAGAFKALQDAAKLGLSGLAFAAIVPSVAWAAVALALGAGHRRRAAETSKIDASPRPTD